MRQLDKVFEALSNSPFRRRFRLEPADKDYLRRKGLPTVLDHAADFVAKRLGPASPVNDGKQTPYRGHPVFVAQHATACCCRRCLEKWHKIPRGRALDEEEKAHVVATLERWLRESTARQGIDAADRGATRQPGDGQAPHRSRI